jgi:hypothetical protein
LDRDAIRARIPGLPFRRKKPAYRLTQPGLGYPAARFHPVPDEEGTRDGIFAARSGETGSGFLQK